MTGFLAKLGTSLADRWLSLLVLPGMLWAAAAAAASRVGQADAFDPQPLVDWLRSIAAQPAEHRTTWLAVAGAVGVLVSAGAGLAAGGLGSALEHLWAAPGTRPPLAWIVRARQRRWNAVRASARFWIAEADNPSRTGTALTRARAQARRAQRRRLAGPPRPPQRPTSIAERFDVSAARSRALYGLDLILAWPRLWSVLPDGLRADVTAARDAYASAARLAGWGLLYAALGLLWWPAVLPGAVVVAAATTRARTSAGVLADLIDTATDLHLVDLAGGLGVPTATLSAFETGHAIAERLTRPQHPAVPAPATGAP
ncbi:hypothetical protein PUR71_08505 [Streptomyces sp. SP17BM10]|uniref:hypothetical protein n=1 Tax=Streptomyces sp. SP17BM10 TaxID=3002530 RepID=UPI002E776E7D|nr:hypothetical protein [Streptomyces sp. SP17BM10]MEE1782955.1 hypothetical protein [Streptomyces sp. SP17BM10]